jgi:hypothetical protein
MRLQLDKRDYWHRLVDYYYDHVHWDSEPTISIYKWLERDYNAVASLNSQTIYFDDPARLEWFLLRWSE